MSKKSKTVQNFNREVYRSAIAESGFNMRALAKKMRMSGHPVSIASLDNYRVGRNKPKLARVQAIANALGITLACLIDPEFEFKIAVEIPATTNGFMATTKARIDELRVDLTGELDVTQNPLEGAKIGRMIAGLNAVKKLADQ